VASMDTRAIEGEIDRIRSLGLEELRREWRRLNHAEPPRISRDLLVLAFGYRLQEIEHGGIGKSTRRKLQTMAKALRTTGRVGPHTKPQPEARRASGSGMVKQLQRNLALCEQALGNVSAILAEPTSVPAPR
jgi:Protein of unknown function (DUF2924)